MIPTIRIKKTFQFKGIKSLLNYSICKNWKIGGENILTSFKKSRKSRISSCNSFRIL